MTLGRTLADLAARLPRGVRELVPPDQRADLRHRMGRYLPWEEGFDLTAPPPRVGETTGPPGFVGVGVTLAGARWWFRVVTDHPEISHRRDLPMDRHYLTHFATQPFGRQAILGYHAWFPRRSGTLTGEWTPGYFDQPWVAPLLAEAAPDAKVLVIVRDPVERLADSLARAGRHRGEHVGWHVSDAVDRSFYADPLRRLHGHVPAERVLVLQYEQCVSDPAAQAAATYRFLGIDDSHRPGRTLLLAPGRHRRPDLRLDAGTLDRLVALYAPDVTDLASMVPELDLSLWPFFAHLQPGSDTG
jgi:Sulfotransferase family